MIKQDLCNSYRVEILRGVHTENDQYHMALYTADAALSQTTTEYTSTHEVVAKGYTKGGQQLQGFRAVLDGGTAILDWTPNPVWGFSHITARGALIYNETKGNRAVCVLNFGRDVSSKNGAPFKVAFPRADAANALIRIGHEAAR